MVGQRRHRVFIVYYSSAGLMSVRPSVCQPRSHRFTGARVCVSLPTVLVYRISLASFQCREFFISFRAVIWWVRLSSSSTPIQRFTILESEKSLIGIFKVHKKGRSASFGALKLWNVRPGLLLLLLLLFLLRPHYLTSSSWSSSKRAS